MKHRYIVIEGPDGSGKSSVAAKLRSLLEKEGMEVVDVRELSATPLCEMIEDIALQNLMHDQTRMHLMSAVRVEAFRNVVMPALSRPNTVVISDRGWPSTLAYQCGTDADRELLKHIVDHTMDVKPYLSILTTDFRTSRKRLAERKGKTDVIESNQDEEEYYRLTETYRSMDYNSWFDTTNTTAEEVAKSILIGLKIA